MNTIFQIDSNDLDSRFIESIKALFKNKKLIISITEDIDETAYLLQSKKNAKRLTDALEEIKADQKLIKITSIEELEALVDNAKNNSN